MAGISRYEKAVLGLTAAFLLFTGGWFLADRQRAQPFEVTTARNLQETADQDRDRSPEEEARPKSLMEGETIDINTADVYELQRLPGIGEKRAQAVAAYREANGPFQSVDDLVLVDGIGEGILDGLRAYAAAELP